MSKSPSAYVLIQHPEHWQKGVPSAIHYDMKKIDMIGKRYGRLVVVDNAPTRRDGPGQCRLMVQARCDCGTWKVVRADPLRRGRFSSCGCLNSEFVVDRNTTHGLAHSTPEYSVWLQMIERCNNPNNRAYEAYGKRGIYVCDRWRDYALFITDMGHRPTDKHSLDRKDNDGPYSPENCRWATPETQARNKRNNHHITYCGRTMTLVEWSQELGISRSLIQWRLKAGWSLNRALSEPARIYI